MLSAWPKTSTGFGDHSADRKCSVIDDYIAFIALKAIAWISFSVYCITGSR